ncbi:uncharacterized protein LOC108029038 [Drosophila biarmipes]|uniref:uncharacterized protein LOC108029038 n=1 Tax=Drosophila biarmipes TaxID=125945 RepID=UPI0007E6C8CE|nr:uncharacterized protein LOC108029038 [Drosophila biarmipes]
MRAVSATDIKEVKESSPNQKSSNGEEDPQKRPLSLEDPKSREEPTTHRSKEELITIQTYSSPNTSKNMDKKSSISENSENIDQPINRNQLNSSKPHGQRTPSDISLLSNGECGPQVTHNKCVEDIGLDTAISGISVDSELSSDLREELLEYDSLKTNKKKRDLKKTENIEDPEEEFRRHFLKTFQELPRISQISLDDKPNKITHRENNKETESNTVEKTPSTSNTKRKNIDSPEKTLSPTNVENSATEIKSNMNISETSKDQVVKEEDNIDKISPLS